MTLRTSSAGAWSVRSDLRTDTEPKFKSAREASRRAASLAGFFAEGATPKKVDVLPDVEVDRCGRLDRRLRSTGRLGQYVKGKCRASIEPSPELPGFP
jgi:hypothetical protein